MCVVYCMSLFMATVYALSLRTQRWSSDSSFSIHINLSFVLVSRRNASPTAINPTHVSVHTQGPSIMHRWVTHANIACKTKGDLNRKPKAEEFWILPTKFLMIAPSPLSSQGGWRLGRVQQVCISLTGQRFVPQPKAAFGKYFCRCRLAWHTGLDLWTAIQVYLKF